MDHCIYYGGVNNDIPNTLDGFSNVSWTRDVDTHKSTFGFTLFLNNGPISWNNRKQTSITLLPNQGILLFLNPLRKQDG